MSSFGLTVTPNPAPEGGTVTVKGKPNTTVYVSAPGRSFAVKLGKNGTAKFKVPVEAGKKFTVGDGALPKAQEVVVSVVSTSR